MIRTSFLSGIFLSLMVSFSVLAAEKKVVLVTGASSGIAKALVEELGSSGEYRVYGTTRQSELVKDYSEGYRLVPMDPGNTESVKQAVRLVLKQESAVDVLINSAGYMVLGSVESVDPEQLLEQFNVNVVGYNRVTREVVPGMREKGKGLIINISSTQAFEPRGLQENYSATRSAIETLSLGQASYLADYGIKVVVFEPGATRTNIVDNSVIGRTRVAGDSAGAQTDKLVAMLRQRFQQGESAENVAKRIAAVIEKEKPDFRIQSNQKGRDRASFVYQDSTGNSLIEKLKKNYQLFKQAL